MNWSRTTWGLLSVIAVTSGFLVGSGRANAAGANDVPACNSGCGSGSSTGGSAGGESLNGYNPPICTTTTAVTVGGVCEDVPQTVGTLTDASGGYGAGIFGGISASAFTQVFRLVTDNLSLLLYFLGAWLTFRVIDYLARRSGSSVQIGPFHFGQENEE